MFPRRIHPRRPHHYAAAKVKISGQSFTETVPRAYQLIGLSHGGQRGSGKTSAAPLDPILEFADRKIVPTRSK